MLAYVDSPDHLKLTMNLLRDKSKNIQYEAFHVFKVLLSFHYYYLLKRIYVYPQVFVANPKKSKPVQDILLKNREKLLAFLPKFHDDRRGERTISLTSKNEWKLRETNLTAPNYRGRAVYRRKGLPHETDS